MKTPIALTAFVLLTASAPWADAGEEQIDPLCTELEAFLASVGPDETRSFALRTFWGAREEGDQIVIGSRSCEHHDYDPGRQLCAYLLPNISIEFAGHNARRILDCLAPGPGIPAGLDIHSGSFSTTYGSPDRGALVDLQLAADEESGEMVLRLQADGF